jgi:hypothetical protein
VVAFLSGGIEGRQFVGEHWLQACAPRRLAKSLEAFADFLYMRLRRFFDKRSVVQRGSTLIPQQKNLV